MRAKRRAGLLLAALMLCTDASPDGRELGDALAKRQEEHRRALEAEACERDFRRELEEIAQGKGIPVPGATFADAAFQKRILAALLSAEQGAGASCFDHRVLSTEATGRDDESRTLVERWVLDRCGATIVYRLRLSPYFVVAGRGAPFVYLDNRSAITLSREYPD